MLSKVKTATLLVQFLLAIALAPAALGQHGQGGGGGHGHGGAVPGPPPGPEAIEVPAQGVSLPMLDFGGRPVVNIKINGKGPYFGKTIHLNMRVVTVA